MPYWRTVFDIRMIVMQKVCCCCCVKPKNTLFEIQKDRWPKFISLSVFLCQSMFVCLCVALLTSCLSSFGLIEVCKKCYGVSINVWIDLKVETKTESALKSEQIH